VGPRYRQVFISGYTYFQPFGELTSSREALAYTKTAAFQSDQPALFYIIFSLSDETGGLPLPAD
jgi:hypothetical protein